MIPNNKIPSLSYPIQNGNANNFMDEISRTKAKAALHSLIQDLRNNPDKYARLVDAKDPLPEDLPSILMLLDEVCRQLTHPDYNSDKNNTINSVKQICSTARIMRQILHSSKACDYRTLGLNSEATQEQIHNHYRWLNTLFSFDETIDPKHHSIRRIMQAYISLTNSDIPYEEDHIPQSTSNHSLITTQELPLWYPDPKTHERKYSGIALSTIVLLTLSGGLGWWWLLDSADTEMVEQTTAFSETAPQNSTENQPAITVAEEEQQQPIPSTASSIDLDEETSISDLETVQPEAGQHPVESQPTIAVSEEKQQPIPSAASSIDLVDETSTSDLEMVQPEAGQHPVESQPTIAVSEEKQQPIPSAASSIDLVDETPTSDLETVQPEANQHSAESQPAIAVSEEEQQPIPSATSSIDLGEETSTSDLDTVQPEAGQHSVESQPAIAVSEEEQQPIPSATSSIDLGEETSTSDLDTTKTESDKQSIENRPAIAIAEEQQQPTQSAASSIDSGEDTSTSDLDTTKAESDKQAIENQPATAVATQKTNEVNEKKADNEIESADSPTISTYEHLGHTVRHLSATSPTESAASPTISTYEHLGHAVKHLSAASPTTSTPKEKNTVSSEQARSLGSTEDKTKAQADATQEKDRIQIQATTPGKQNINPPMINPFPPESSMALKIQPSRIAVENEFDNTSNSQVSKKQDIDIKKTTPVATINKATPKPTENSLMEMMLVIGSPDLEINSLSKEEVENIFLGKMTTLPNGQKIELFDQQDGNTIKRNFYAAVTGKTPRQIKAHWSKLQFKGLIHPPKTLINDQATKERVATSKFAISYINGASLDDSVKVLRSY